MNHPFLPEHRLNIVVGNFGSGKTEVAVNLALDLARDRAVTMVDLDIVNPYFRCREAREEMESRGIEVIFPKGEFHAADLPIILPEVRGVIGGDGGYVIFDVGGDDLGARVLSSLADLMERRPYDMFQVINTKRPFTEDVEGCLKMRDEIEAASRLKITGLVANTHLMEETDAAIVLAGIETARAVAERAGIPLVFAAADRSLLPELEGRTGDCPVLPVERRMTPPWMTRNLTDRAGRVLKKDGRPGPKGIC